MRANEIWQGRELCIIHLCIGGDDVDSHRTGTGGGGGGWLAGLGALESIIIDWMVPNGRG